MRNETKLILLIDRQLRPINTLELIDGRHWRFLLFIQMNFLFLIQTYQSLCDTNNLWIRMTVWLMHLIKILTPCLICYGYASIPFVYTAFNCCFYAVLWSSAITKIFAGMFNRWVWMMLWMIFLFRCSLIHGMTMWTFLYGGRNWGIPIAQFIHRWR